MNGGPGDDNIVLADRIIEPDADMTVSDGDGDNAIQIVDGMALDSSKVAPEALKLNLADGAEVTILDADEFTYEVGDNLLSESPDESMGYQDFVEEHLGTTVPDDGINMGGPTTIEAAPTRVPINDGGDTVTGQSGEDEVFVFDATGPAGGDFTLNGFEPGTDTLEVIMPDGAEQTNGEDLTQLHGVAMGNGNTVAIQQDPFAGDSFANFGLAEDQSTLSLNVTGIEEPSRIDTEVV